MGPEGPGARGKDSVDPDPVRDGLPDPGAAGSVEPSVSQCLVRAVRTDEWLQARAEMPEGAGGRAAAMELHAALAGRVGTDVRWVLKLGGMCRSDAEKKMFSELLDGRLSMQPANVDLLVASARVLMEKNRPGEARGLLERAVLLKPEHAEARSLLEGLLSG
jgi:hypothetical protein